MLYVHFTPSLFICLDLGYHAIKSFRLMRMHDGLCLNVNKIYLIQ